METELTAWLLACVQADEDRARAAVSDDPNWVALPCEQCHGHVSTVTEARKNWPSCVFECYPHEGGGLYQPEAHHHIAAWDPERVLVECDTKRRIIAQHEVMDRPLRCRECGACPDCSWDEDPRDWPCQTLRLLALPYRDRDGYRADLWAPDGR